MSVCLFSPLHHAHALFVQAESRALSGQDDVYLKSSKSCPYILFPVMGTMTLVGPLEAFSFSLWCNFTYRMATTWHLFGLLSVEQTYTYTHRWVTKIVWSEIWKRNKVPWKKPQNISVSLMSGRVSLGLVKQFKNSPLYFCAMWGA